MISAGCLLLFVLYLACGSRRHALRLRSIPIRIHVNGTRGKSTVTRLIAAGFREAGYRTIAKTTGTSARLLLEDGSELELERPGPSNIGEQMEIVAFAARRHAQVLVLECMAVKPELQRISQQHLVRGTCSVVTNVRPDHQEEMGETLAEIAWNLGWVAPEGGLLVTAEQEEGAVAQLRARATGVAARLLQVEAADGVLPPDETGLQFPENVAVALQVCALHGVERSVALAGILAAPPDPGALAVINLDRGESSVPFVNAFAANDVVSTEQIIQQVRSTTLAQQVFVVASARTDRPRRTVDMAAMMSNGLGLSGAFLIGDGANLLERMVRQQAPDLPVVNLSREPHGRVIERICQDVSGDACVIGVGNIVGAAADLWEYAVGQEAENWQQSP
jgi:poly-gamma-glutamate synthase PgsB/CapB